MQSIGYCQLTSQKKIKYTNLDGLASDFVGPTSEILDDWDREVDINITRPTECFA